METASIDKTGAHRFPLGSIVRVNVDLSREDKKIKIALEGVCQLYIVGHITDSSGTPLYIVSDLPVAYPIDNKAQSLPCLEYRSFATIVEYFFEEDIQLLDKPSQPLCQTIEEWLRKEQ